MHVLHVRPCTHCVPIFEGCRFKFVLRKGPDKKESSNSNEHVGMQKGANFSVVCTHFILAYTAKVKKTPQSSTYIHPYYPTIFRITKSGLSLNNTEILCGEHVKL